MPILGIMSEETALPYLDLLPEEVLIKTFEILPNNDLKAISQLSPQFEVIIFKTQKLCKRFLFKLDARNPKTEILKSSNRKYLNIDIHNINEENVGRVLEVLERFSDSLKRVKLKRLRLDVKTFFKVIQLLPNVQKLKIEESEICINESQELFEVPTLESLEIMNLKSVIWSDNNEKSLQHIFSSFVHSQHRLRALKFNGCDLINFLSLSGEENCLKLEKLSLNSNYMPPEKEEEMSEFLLHQSAIKEIKITTPGVFYDTFILKQILRMDNPGLKLVLQTRNFSLYFDDDKDHKSNSITKLKVQSNWSVKNFLELFPNLEELEIIGESNNPGLEDSISDMKSLKKLQIDLKNWDFSLIKCPALEFLEVHFTDTTKLCLSDYLFKRNPNIRHIVFHFPGNALKELEKDGMVLCFLKKLMRDNLKNFEGLKIYVGPKLTYKLVKKEGKMLRTFSFGFMDS